eukprot:649482-Rhodomonas_salina.1
MPQSGSVHAYPGVFESAAYTGGSFAPAVAAARRVHLDGDLSRMERFIVSSVELAAAALPALLSSSWRSLALRNVAPPTSPWLLAAGDAPCETHNLLV